MTGLSHSDLFACRLAAPYDVSVGPEPAGYLANDLPLALTRLALSSASRAGGSRFSQEERPVAIHLPARLFSCPTEEKRA